jgi:ABC-type branched-subunit amino acid transport system ATPase component
VQVTTTTTVTSGSTTTTDSTTDSATASASSTTTSRDYPRLTLGAGVAYSWQEWKVAPELSVFANYRLAGPLGVWGQASTFGQFSLGLSLTF